jgi:hypothetical protein
MLLLSCMVYAKSGRPFHDHVCIVFQLNMQWTNSSVLVWFVTVYNKSLYASASRLVTMLYLIHSERIYNITTWKLSSSSQDEEIALCE